MVKVEDRTSSDPITGGELDGNAMTRPVWGATTDAGARERMRAGAAHAEAA